MYGSNAPSKQTPHHYSFFGKNFWDAIPPNWYSRIIKTSHKIYFQLTRLEFRESRGIHPADWPAIAWTWDAGKSFKVSKKANFIRGFKPSPNKMVFLQVNIPRMILHVSMKKQRLIPIISKHLELQVTWVVSKLWKQGSLYHQPETMHYHKGNPSKLPQNLHYMMPPPKWFYLLQVVTPEQNPMFFFWWSMG